MSLFLTRFLASSAITGPSKRWRARRAGRPFSLCVVVASAYATIPTVSAQALLPGNVVGWGGNYSGQAVPPAGLTDVKAISGGSLHSLALKTDGTVVGWGYNFSGQMNIPIGLVDVKAISAGSAHNLALKTDGTVVAWGNDSYGQATVPAGLSGVTAIAAGSSHSLALKSDGTVVAWGQNASGQKNIPAGLRDVKAISSGEIHSMALKTDGTVVAWGYNYDGQTVIPEGLRDVKAIAAGGFHNLALKNDGTVVAWGTNYFGESNVPQGLSDVKAIAGGYHSLALKNDGTVVAWGYNYDGQSTVPAGLSGVTAIEAGTSHSLAANVPIEQEIRPYMFIGFQSPVDNLGAVNHGKAGRTYPLKWQLKDADGKFVTTPGAVQSITYKAAQCGSFNNVTGGTMQAESSGKAGLKAEASSKQYHYNWATPSTAGCYTLRMTLDTGQVQEAYFNLMK